MRTVTKGFDAWLANRALFYFLTFGHAGAGIFSARVPESQKIKMVG